MLETNKLGLLHLPDDINDFHEKINYLLNHPEESYTFSSNARKFALDTFSWKNISYDILSILEI
ncbi:MAG: hypothetical protein JWM09_597, partial [Francisellaceae bacterium]|nr:hypothetical protein [Francisellaceae bacterium]